MHRAIRLVVVKNNPRRGGGGSMADEESLFISPEALCNDIGDIGT
jgi:hypothetical protein